MCVKVVIHSSFVLSSFKNHPTLFKNTATPSNRLCSRLLHRSVVRSLDRSKNHRRTIKEPFGPTKLGMKLFVRLIMSREGETSTIRRTIERMIGRFDERLDELSEDSATDCSNDWMIRRRFGRMIGRSLITVRQAVRDKTDFFAKSRRPDLASKEADQ